MPQRQDDMEQRRRRRAALEQKRRKQQQMLRLKLGLAAVILLACVALVLFLTAGGDKAPAIAETVPGEPQYTIPPEEEATRVPDTPTTTIHIMAAGDLNITDKVVQSGKAQYGDYYDYTEAFLDVAPVLSTADLTLLNFEGNMVGPPYGTATASAPIELGQALSAAGVDIVQMANTYSIYNGMIGLSQTLENLRSAGLEPVGAFSSPEEFEQSKGYTICEIQGIKVAVVGFTKGMGSLGLPEGSESCVNKLFVDYDSEYKKIDRAGIRSILEDVQSERPDITIAMVHWGAEYNDTVFEAQEDIAELMIDEGVDIILGTHSHMVHRIDFDKKESTLVAYSLGDFFGDGSKSGTAYSIILDIQITRDNDMGTTKIDSFSVTPIYTLSEAEGNGQRRVVRIDEAIDAYNVNFVDKVTTSAKESMEYSLERIEARLDPEAWEAKQEALKEAG